MDYLQCIRRWWTCQTARGEVRLALHFMAELGTLALLFFLLFAAWVATP